LRITDVCISQLTEPSVAVSIGGVGSGFYLTLLITTIPKVGFFFWVAS